MYRLVSPLVLATLLAGTLAGAACASKPPQPDPPPPPVPSTEQTVAASATPPAAASARAQTSEERRAALDKRLNDSLGSFDAQLRKEQQKIAQERDARQSTVSESAAAEAQPAGKSGTGEVTDPSGGRHGESARQGARSGDLKSDKSASATAASPNGNGATAREIPDGSDDDVVARRLRKAAEQETDPELREKLWKEYADYKKNAQGK